MKPLKHLSSCTVNLENICFQVIDKFLFSRSFQSLISVTVDQNPSANSQLSKEVKGIKKSTGRGFKLCLCHALTSNVAPQRGTAIRSL